MLRSAVPEPFCWDKIDYQKPNRTWGNRPPSEIMAVSSKFGWEWTVLTIHKSSGSLYRPSCFCKSTSTVPENLVGLSDWKSGYITGFLPSVRPKSCWQIVSGTVGATPAEYWSWSGASYLEIGAAVPETTTHSWWGGRVLGMDGCQRSSTCHSVGRFEHHAKSANSDHWSAWSQNQGATTPYRYWHFQQNWSQYNPVPHFSPWLLVLSSFCHLVLHWTPQLRTDWSDMGLHWVWPGTNQGHQDLETHWPSSNSSSLVWNQKWSTSLYSDEQNAGGGSNQSPMLHEWAWPLPSTRTAVPDQENQVQPLRCSAGTSLEANSGVIEPETSQIVLSKIHLLVPCSCCRELTCWCCTDCWTSPAGNAVYLCPSN